MNKLLDEARNEAARAEATCQEGDHYDIGYLSAWNDAVALIEKYEQTVLTEEQEEIYRNMMLAKKYFAEGYDFVDTDCLVATTIESFINEWATTKDYMIDENFVPALRKFLNEVAE